jgi:hypothetical protein
VQFVPSISPSLTTKFQKNTKRLHTFSDAKTGQNKNKQTAIYLLSLEQTGKLEA